LEVDPDQPGDGSIGVASWKELPSGSANAFVVVPIYALPGAGGRMAHTESSADDPLAIALARDDAGWARDHLERDVVAWLTTVAPDGRVQSSVVSFLFDGGALYFYSQPGTPKIRNLAHSPVVSFHLQSDPYGDHWLIIEGTATIDPTIPPLDTNERYVAKYTEPHAHWGLDFTQTARDFGAPIRIHPTRVRLG
jgi:PPOX class probable F420-dependent enzyme